MVDKGGRVVPPAFPIYRIMKVQGIELQTKLKKADIPKDCELVKTEGLPEAIRDGIAYLVDVDGTLYPRIVNNGRHVALSIPGKTKGAMAHVWQKVDKPSKV